MDTRLMPGDVVARLLRSEMVHSDLPRGTLNCCSVGDLFFEIEKLKKRGHSMSGIVGSSTEFHEAVRKHVAHVAPLDSQALQGGLFESETGEASFFQPAVAAGHPSDTITIIALRDFDGVWGTDFLAARLRG